MTEEQDRIPGQVPDQEERTRPEAADMLSENQSPLIDDQRLASIVESLLLVSAAPLTVARINALVGADIPALAIENVLADLMAQYREGGRGICLAPVSGGYQLRSNPENADYVGRLFEARPSRLSQAALEVLAVVAYRQPVTRLEIEDIRGVDSSGVLKMLMERRLIKVLGFKEEPGHPRLYGTSRQFLEFFGLSSITDLPTLREYEQLNDQSRQRLDDLLSRGVKARTGVAASGDSYPAASAGQNDGPITEDQE